jgi:hypothetical protein
MKFPFKLLQVLKILNRLIPNPFKIAASIMNVDSKWLSTFKINIPHYEQVFSLSPIGGLVFTFLVSYWLACTFFLTNTDSRKYANISHYFPHHAGVKRSPMHIHDGTGKSMVNYLHYECTELIAKCFHEENSGALPSS